MKKDKTIPEDLFQQMVKDRKVRKAITRENFSYFFHFYYAHYVKHATADFQKEIMYSLGKSDKESLYVVAFRGSGKSTIATTAYPVWSILGKQQKKFVVIFCQTRTQAKQHMMNLRQELENNDVLKRDMGPFQEESDEWGSNSLVFSNTGARITVASTEQSIRGLRHHQHRPDLVILDDVEDINSTKTRESRNKTYRWLKREVIPMGDTNTRLIVVGNLLHEDSLLMRLKEETDEVGATGIFMMFPLIDRSGICLWPSKYPAVKDIEAKKRDVSNEIAWQREYLLNIIPDVEQVIHKGWIQFYSDLPKRDRSFSGVRIGVDLAISEKTTADHTAMVSACIYREKKGMFIYILPNPVNERLTSPATIDKCKSLHRYYESEDMWPKFIVEDVGYQKSLIQHLEEAGLDAQGYSPGRQDKRSRLALTALKIKSGNVLFPKQGCESLIRQLIHFGVERYDDLSDAFSTLILGISTDPPGRRGSIHDMIVGGKPNPLWEEFGDHPVTMDTQF